MRLITTLTVTAAAAVAKTIIPTPSAAQLRYQETDFIALIHFNMGTYAHNGDPCCDSSNWNVVADYADGMSSSPATFNPVKLNTTQWMESISALGANIAILTAKHGCGFTIFESDAKLPNGEPYGYGVNSTLDVVRQFVDAADAYGVGYGLYYSIMKNFKLCRSFSGTNSCMDEVLPNQLNLTDQDYEFVVRQHLEEIWTNYGNFTEVWVDSVLPEWGAEMMEELQGQAIGTPENPTYWCGTESGNPSADVSAGDFWSTSSSEEMAHCEDSDEAQNKCYVGNKDGDLYLPKFCDPQLFEEHVWFWEDGLNVRTLKEMIPIYHDIVGRGMVMELAFSINRDGLVDESHAEVYKQLGDWVRECYGTPIGQTMGGIRDVEYELEIEGGIVFDRFQLAEDVVSGQRVHDYAITMSVDGADDLELHIGKAIGRKKIVLLDEPITTDKKSVLKLTVKDSVAPPIMEQFAVFSPCASA